jgi:hypothetical protein
MPYGEQKNLQLNIMPIMELLLAALLNTLLQILIPFQHFLLAGQSLDILRVAGVHQLPQPVLLMLLEMLLMILKRFLMEAL